MVDLAPIVLKLDFAAFFASVEKDRFFILRWMPLILDAPSFCFQSRSESTCVLASVEHYVVLF